MTDTAKTAEQIAVIHNELKHLTRAIDRMSGAVEKLTEIEQRLRRLDDHETRIRALETTATKNWAYICGIAATFSFVTPLVFKFLGAS